MPDGWTLRYSPITDSTNDDAKAAVRAGAADRTVFIADEQRRGRGRLGRSWVAPSRSGLLCSIILSRQLPPVFLTALCSLSVVEAIREVVGLDARIKWPNDVMINDRKACGILTEVVFPGAVGTTVVGIGLNVNIDPATSGLPEGATSLSAEARGPVSRPDLLCALLSTIDRRLQLENAFLLAEVHKGWDELLWRRRQRIAVGQDGRSVMGIVEGLSPSGALILRADDGRVEEIVVGDVLVE